MPDRLTERLMGLAEDVGGGLRPAPATVIRERGQQRRLRFVSGGIGVAGVVILTLVGLSLLLSPGAGAPVGTQVTVPVLMMPHQGDPGWIRNDDRLAPSAFNPCSTVDVTGPGRISAVTMTGTAVPEVEAHSPTRYSEQLFVYSTVDRAHAVVNQLAAAMPGCDWAGGLTGETEYGRLGAAGSYPRVLPVAGAPAAIKGAYVTTRHNAVIILYFEMTGAFMSGMDYGDAARIAFQACGALGICDSQTCSTVHVSFGNDGPQTCPGQSAESYETPYPESTDDPSRPPVEPPGPLVTPTGYYPSTLVATIP